MSTQGTIIILACIIAFCYLVTMFYNYKWNKEKDNITKMINDLYWDIGKLSERIINNTKLNINQAILELMGWMKSEIDKEDKQ